MAGTRDQLDSMPPWDAATYFQAVEEQTVAVNTTPVQFLKADPMRVALVIGNTGSNPVSVSIKRRAATGTGFTSQTSGFPLMFLFQETGPLCQSEWWAISTGAGQLTFYAVALTRWPTRRVASNGRAKRAKRP